MQSSSKELNMRNKSWAAGALAVLAVAAMPVAANAKPYKEATFKATLSGSQVTTFEYHRPNDRDDPCDASADAYGDQTIKFDAKRKFQITFRTPPRRQPNLYLTNGRPTVFSVPFSLPVDATAERNGDSTVHAGDIGPNCGDNGGADPGYVPPAKDCGVRDGRFNVRFYFHDGSPDSDLIVPIGRQLPDKNRLKMEGSQYEWGLPGSDDTSTTLSSTYANCPWSLSDSYVEDAGNIWISPAKIAEPKLFDRSRKKLVISGDNIVNLSQGNTTGKTILAWNLRMTRVK
jgi:hypothetical protein